MKKSNNGMIGSSFWMKGSFDLYSSIIHQQNISNFVRILSGQNIPVVFNTEQHSYTNGKEIVIGTKINEENLDSVVGLALHEASHIVLSDFDTLNSYDYLMRDTMRLSQTGKKQRNPEVMSLLINYIEDRRIDRWAYDTSPGYQIYYKALYDKFFYTKELSKVLNSGMYTDESWESYQFRIINILHVDNDLNSLKGLPLIYKKLDIDNINRLKDTSEVISLAEEIYDIIDAYAITENSSTGTTNTNMAKGKRTQCQSDNSGNNNSEENQGASSNENESSEESQDSSEEENENTPKSDNTSDDDSKGNPNKESKKKSEPDSPKNTGPAGLTNSEFRKVIKNIEAQKNLIKGNPQETHPNNSSFDISTGCRAIPGSIGITNMEEKNRRDISEELNSIVKANPQLYMTDGFRIGVIDINRNFLNNIKDPYTRDIYDFISYNPSFNAASVKRGVSMGKRLIKKLEILEEENKEITQYKRKGKLDVKRMVYYNNDDRIFNKIVNNITQGTTIHLSIDMSTSMEGHKWDSTVELMVALAYCANNISKFDLKIDGRIDYGILNVRGNIFWLLNIYDSKKTKWSTFMEAVNQLKCSGATPEGILLNQISKTIHPDTYLFVLTDGEPNYSCKGYDNAVDHTKYVVDKMLKNNQKINAFYIGDSKYPNKNFQKIYGKNGITIDTKDVHQISRTVNKILLD